MKESLKILFISAEVAPFAKTGGLADVAGSLPHKLQEMGHDVRVVMPGYKIIGSRQNDVTDFPVEMGGQQRTCIVRQLEDAACITYTLNNYHYLTAATFIAMMRRAAFLPVQGFSGALKGHRLQAGHPSSERLARGACRHAAEGTVPGA